jgi:hypothetical protein
MAMQPANEDLLSIARRLFTTTTERDWREFVELIHPDAEIALRSAPGRIIHGRDEMEEFARNVISRRQAHEISVDTLEQIADDAVVALGRLFLSDQRGTADMPVGWLMLFEDRMLRRSWLVDSVATAQQLLASVRARD